MPSMWPTSSFLPCGANDDQQALRVVLPAGLYVDADGPELDLALGGEITFAPAGVLVRPGLLEPPDRRGREASGVMAKQSQECFLEVPARDALR